MAELFVPTPDIKNGADRTAVETLPSIDELKAIFRKFLLINSTVPDTFTGVPQEMRPALDLSTVAPDEQFDILINRFASMVYEVLTVENKEIFVRETHRKMHEETAQVESAYRIQLERPKVKDDYWMPQLWFNEMTLYDDAFHGEAGTERLDIQIGNQISGLTNSFLKLQETDVVKAAEQRPIILQKLQSLLAQVVERSSIVFQMSNASKSTVRPLIGFMMERTVNGCQVYPVFITQQRRQVTDRTTPLLGDSRGTTSQTVSEETYKDSELGRIFTMFSNKDWANLSSAG